MELKYWAQKALEEQAADGSALRQTEAEQTVSEQTVAEQTVAEQTIAEQTVAEQNADNIVVLDEIRQVKQEEKEFEQKEIDEFFEKEEKKEAKGRVAKYIFVDGLLGIPFLTVCDLIISAFVALFFVIAVVFLASFAVLLAGSVMAIGFGFAILPGRVPTALATIAVAVLALAISLVFLLLAILFGLRIMPWTARLAVKLENKLHLFRS